MTARAVMRAAQYDGYGPPGMVHVRTVPIPQLQSKHVLVRVAATSVNAADVTIRAGKLRWLTGRKFPRGTGFDFTGKVVAADADADGVALGDLVWGFLDGIRQGPNAAAADYVLAPAAAVAKAPRTLDPVSAAALPGAAGAALLVLVRLAEVRAGDRVLIRGAGGGVGTAAVQLAFAMGAEVTALARAEHHEALRALGAAATVDYRRVDPAELGRFDVIVDVVGTGMRPWRKLLTRRGRYLLMALGRPKDVAYLGASMVFGPKRIRFVQAPPDGEILADLARRVDEGTVQPVIAASFALPDIDSAHRALERGGALGKQLVVVDAVSPDTAPRSEPAHEPTTDMKETRS